MQLIKFFNSELKLGIIAGGQLGKMLIQEASKWDIITYVLDPDENCSAGSIASVFIKGNFHDFDDVYNFGKQVDILTYEIESINTGALNKLKEEGLEIIPDPSVLEMIQDKGRQKEFYRDHNIPTAPFSLYTSKSEILEAIDSNRVNFPFVQKLRRGGYDGRGVAVIESAGDIGSLLDGASVVEHKVEIEKEIAVIAARNGAGDVRCFPTVEMVFDKRANLVDKLVCPSGIPDDLANQAKAIAAKMIEKLNMAGVLAIEFFVDKNGGILVNEIAPRPHNSGHHTIESVMTSQYEQHLRAILNLPLGSTMLKMPSVMINLLGEEGHTGPVYYEGLDKTLALEGVKVHLYGKKITRPYRKMGHVTIIARTVEDAASKAVLVKKTLKVKTWKKNS
jgi:5-(carboxyamino)imidazole ribonucleotide synthase